ncbi:MAG: hypothetical protein ACYTBJ_14210 [Planctomycetota bacterium]
MKDTKEFSTPLKSGKLTKPVSDAASPWPGNRILGLSKPIVLQKGSCEAKSREGKERTIIDNQLKARKCGHAPFLSGLVPHCQLVERFLLRVHKNASGHRTPLGNYLFFFSFFNFRFSFAVSWAFFCFSLLPLSFFPLSPILVSPCLKMTCIS